MEAGIPVPNAELGGTMLTQRQGVEIVWQSSILRVGECLLAIARGPNR